MAFSSQLEPVLSITLFTLGYTCLHVWLAKYCKVHTRNIYYTLFAVNTAFNIVLGLICVWMSRSELPYGAAFGYNPSQPLVQLILDHDLGHILYDLYHVITWNKKLRLHHIICIIGFGSVRASKAGGMIAVVDSILADTGSAVRDEYYRNPSMRMFKIVTATYGVTRSLLLIWSLFIVIELFSNQNNWVSPYYPHIVAFAQLALMAVLWDKVILLYDGQDDDESWQCVILYI